MKMRLCTSRRPLPLAACVCCLLFIACSRDSEPKWEKDLSEGNYIALPPSERPRENKLPRDVNDFSVPPVPQTLQKAEEPAGPEEPKADDPPTAPSKAETPEPAPAVDEAKNSEPPHPPAQSLQKVAPSPAPPTKGSEPPKIEPLRKPEKAANERPSLKRPIPVESNGKSDG
jgi:hypothetical protein